MNTVQTQEILPGQKLKKQLFALTVQKLKEQFAEKVFTYVEKQFVWKNKYQNIFKSYC